jgi:hypothetical protein
MAANVPLALVRFVFVRNGPAIWGDWLSILGCTLRSALGSAAASLQFIAWAAACCHWQALSRCVSELMQ